MKILRIKQRTYSTVILNTPGIKRCKQNGGMEDKDSKFHNNVDLDKNTSL